MSGAAFASLARPAAAPSHAAPKPSPRLQAKLNISTPGDHFEREADSVADQIMRMPQPGSAPPSPPPNVPYAAPTGGDALVQRACKQCEAEKKSEDSATEKSTGNSASHGGGDMLIQRVCYEAECEPWTDDSVDDVEEDEPEVVDVSDDETPPVQQQQQQQQQQQPQQPQQLQQQQWQWPQLQQATPSTVSDMSIGDSPRAPSRSLNSGPSSTSASLLSTPAPAQTSPSLFDLLPRPPSVPSGSQSSGSSSEAPVRARRAREPAAAAAALQDDAEIPVSQENRERAKRRNAVLEDEPAPTATSLTPATGIIRAIDRGLGIERPEDGPPSSKRAVAHDLRRTAPTRHTTREPAAAAAAASAYTPLSNLSPVPTVPSPSPYLSIGSFQFNVTGFDSSFGSGPSGSPSSGSSGQSASTWTPPPFDHDLWKRLFQRKPRASQPDKPTPLSDVGLPSGGGRPLSGEERGFFEPRLGRDLSSIRLHTDGQAASSADSLNARAFTYGHNVVLNQGEYTPGSDSGRRLLAHELTHAVQQGAAGPAMSADAPAISSVSSATVQRLCKATNRSSGSPEQIMIQSYLTKANPSVEKEYQVKNPAGGDCYYLDLADVSTFSIFEIKPKHTPNLGAAQLADYRNATRKECLGGTQWHIGTQAEFAALINNAVPPTYQNATVSGPWYLPGIRADEAIEITSPSAGQVVFETIPIEGLPGRSLGKLVPADRRTIVRDMTPAARGIVLSRLGRGNLETALSNYSKANLYTGLQAAGGLTGAGGALITDATIEATLAGQPLAELQTAARTLRTNFVAQFGGFGAVGTKTKPQLAAKIRTVVATGTGATLNAVMSDFTRPEARAALLAAHIKAGRANPNNITKARLGEIMATLTPAQLGVATGAVITAVGGAGAGTVAGLPNIAPKDAAQKLPATALRGMNAGTRGTIVTPGANAKKTKIKTSTASSPGVSEEAIQGRPIESQFRTWADGEITASRAWMWTSINATAPAGALKTAATNAQGGNAAAQTVITDLWKWSLRL